MTATTTRIGVAIAVPDPWGAELERWRASFGDPQAHAIPAHITLLPPTEVAADRLAAVEAHLSTAAAHVPAFDVHLRGTGTFRPVSPVVFVALARGIGGCERLESAVRSGISAARTWLDTRPWPDTRARRAPDRDAPAQVSQATDSA